MPRPNRLYTIDGKYYYIKDGKKVFVKVPAGVSQKQVSKINIKNIIKLAESKRVVRKKKRRNLSYQKKIVPSMQKAEPSGLPIYFFKPKREILTIDEIANNSTDTSIDKLGKVLLKGISATPSSSKLPTEPTIATPPPKKEKSAAEKSQEAYERAMAERKRVQMEDSAFKAAAQRPITPPKAKANVAGVATRIRKFLTGSTVTPSKEDITTPTSTIATETFERAKKRVADEKTVGRTLQFRPIQEESKIANEPSPGIKGEPSPGIKGELGGDGYGSSDGLYDDEIEKIAKKRLKDYVPCIAKDETNELMKYVKKGDKQFSFVINTDNSDQPGRHWRCVYINNMDDYPSIEYFDPLTEGKPEQSLIDICRKIAIKMNPSKLFKYKQNMIRRQSKLTSNCGYHCIHFLEGRYMGIPFSEITGYDQFVEDMKKQHGELDGSGSGEKQLEPFMKAYDSYI